MDTPEFSAALSLPDRDHALGAGGARLDDVAGLFPDMEVFHDLRVSGPDEWRLIGGVTAALANRGACLVSLSARRCDSGQVCVRCRLSGLSSAQTDGLTAALNRLDAVASARLEHVLLRARSKAAMSQQTQST